MVCRYLGRPSGGRQLGNSHSFGQGSGPIHMSDVACTGSEATIFDCSFSSTTGCSHGEDVGVECKLIENITFFLSLLQTLLLQT